MKKTTLTLLFLSLLALETTFAQDDAKFRFGVKVQPSIAWFKPTDVTTLKNEGADLKFGYGLITEFKLNKVASFATGLEMTQAGGTLKFDNTIKDAVYYTPKGDTLDFFVSTRQFKINNIDLPICLKMKTPEIGAMTYFAQFGTNISVKWNGKAIDVGGFENTTQRNSKLPALDIKKDISFIQLGLNVGAGVEWNLAGSTSLLFSANFHNGFTNALRKNSKTLYSHATKTELPQLVKAQFISLTVGFLF